MQCTCVFILLIGLAAIQATFSFDTINDDQSENKLDEIRQIPSSLLSEKQTNIRACISKFQLSNILNRNRRASISRPYFQYVRPARDNRHYSAKNSLAFSPRLGKRAIEGEDEFENFDTRSAYPSSDLARLLTALVNHLQEEKIDVVYEDSTKICLSKPISTPIIQEFFDKYVANRRNQNEQDREEGHQRQSTGKHPVLFRYRLG
ncbi:unnamed protein product [Rotaria socialis]|uniref:Uncharacterized protein n=1 Tax=Rotaria socialis TaxID=392032 RepID=A0A820LGK4_9BILA|nr:unnamed protein product [Rotaria socialis]CAF3269072.1 unnamed protein product [Rotaria socialis]CAF3486526.1 unnamed protein product [Rotaria socialis]CAF3702561.1 unnamed protein product [Rotaria socialis]CAF3712226.1 unnamed protein product [Rotaria socialis]